MATVRNAKIKLAYDDATSRTYTFSGITQQQAAGVKLKVININDSLAAGTANDFANTFVSETGRPCKMISQAQIITVNQEVVYNAN